jgi:hypothetical protein
MPESRALKTLDPGIRRDDDTHRLWRAAVMSMACCLSTWAIAAEQPLQKTPVTLSAADLLPKTMLKGEGYSVNSKVTNDGFQNTYSMKTDYGNFSVTGDHALRARIQEIRATRALEELERSDAFKDAVKDTASGMVEGGKALVTSPVETSKGAVKGLGRWMGNVGRSVTSKDPHQENALKVALGHDAVKRAYAIEMGVDPYTDFEPFQKQLGEVARASTAGGLIMSVGADVATSGTMAGTVVTVVSVAGMKDLLMDEPPSTLSRINREKLEKMGVGKIQIDALLKNYNYTPADMTLMVEALNRMGKIKGRDIFVTYATAAPDKVIARYMQQYAEMLANFISNVEPGDIVNIGDEAWLVTRSGKLIGAFPIDYLAWTAEVDGAERAASEGTAKLNVKSKELLIEGQVGPVAAKALKARGWKVSENVELAAQKSAKPAGKSGVTPAGVGSKIVR